MDTNEKDACRYWELLAIAKKIEHLLKKGVIADDGHPRQFMLDCKHRLHLEEPVEQLMDKAYLRKIENRYGCDMMTSPLPLFMAQAKARTAAGIDPKYRNFSEIVAKSGLEITPSYALQSWLRSRNTVAILTLWETDYNSAFQADEARLLLAEMENKNSALTLKQWISRTGAIGIVALQGRYGGTYAHPTIATDFEAWLVPRERLRLFELLTEWGTVKLERL